MIPSPWVAVVLALAAFRCTRLIGYEDFPPVLRLRRWVVGAKTATAGSTNARMRVTNEPVEETTVYRWPTLSKLLWCAYCLGFHVSVAIYLLWIWFPTATMYGAFPLALSAAVGLIARNLDP